MSAERREETGRPVGDATVTARQTPVRAPRSAASDRRANPMPAQPASDRSEPKSHSLSVAAHPRAVHRIAQARECGGLAGFLVCGYLSLPTHTLLSAGLRALVAGIACYVVVWGAAVMLWRHLVVAELTSREHALLEAHAARVARLTAPDASSAMRANTRSGA